MPKRKNATDPICKPYAKKIAIESNSSSSLDKIPKIAASNRNKLSAVHKSKMLPRSEENRRVNQTRSSKNKTGSVYRYGQRSKPSVIRSNYENKFKKEFEETHANRKICTPLGKPAVQDSINQSGNDTSVSPVKTPPVESSLSPNIQCKSRSRIQVLNSAATPFCYGSGHLISGVTDNRKCRRRGSLRGGFENKNLFYDNDGNENVAIDLQDISIPLLTEASVRWLSPEGGEDRCKLVCDDNGLDKFESLSSPSLSLGNSAGLLRGNGSFRGNDSIYNVECNVRDWNGIASPWNATELEGLLEPVNGIDESLSIASPSSPCLAGGNSLFFKDDLSSGNIIQTPNSKSSSHGCCVEGLKSEVHCLRPEISSIENVLNRVVLTPRSEMYGMESSGLGLDFDAAISQMKISWKDGLVSGNIETEELDCCCELEEELNGGEDIVPSNENDLWDKSLVGNGKDDIGGNVDITPIISEYEPSISAVGKGKLQPLLPSSVESICTDGGGLVASSDSDWTYCSGSQHFSNLIK